jgi:hypothetical protein
VRFRHWRTWATPAVAVALTVGVLAPVLLHRGFVLVYDMVFVPRQPLLPSSVGLGPAPPRAVPADAVVALVTTVLPGDLLQKLVLAGALLAGALGAARLVPTDRAIVRVIAAVGYTWNAYVAERLFIGHWPVLLAYGVLPWVVHAGLAVRRGDPRAWPRLVLWMVPAVLGPTGGLLAAGAAVAAVGRRHAAPALGVALVLNAPWWLPSVLQSALSPSGAVSDPAGVAAFAARGESWAGPVLSVLGLGGIWNADVVPDSRDSPIAPVITLLFVALALYGCRVLARRWGAAPARALLMLGGLGLLIALAGSLPLLDDGLRWAVATLPGAGLLRDGQRFAAWWALVMAIGVALGAEDLAERLPDALGRGALLAGAALLPLAVLPDLALGGLGRLQPVDYPSDWAAAAEAVRAEPGDVLVLPFMTYRSFSWNGGRTQLDPAPRLLPSTTITDDALAVGGTAGESAEDTAGESAGGSAAYTTDATIIGGEDRRAAAVRKALADGVPLDRLGVRWVLVEHGTPGELPTRLEGLTPRHQGEWVTLYRVSPAPDNVPPPASAPSPVPPAVPVLIADALALLLAGGALLWLLLPVGRVGAPAEA